MNWSSPAAPSQNLDAVFGALADPTAPAPWPGELHMTLGAVAIAVNVVCAVAELRVIRAQSRLMDEALSLLNTMPAATVADHEAIERHA